MWNSTFDPEVEIRGVTSCFEFIIVPSYQSSSSDSSVSSTLSVVSISLSTLGTSILPPASELWMLEIPEGSTWQIGGGKVSLVFSFLTGVLDRRFLCGCTDSLGSMDFFVSITDMFFILKGAISLEIMVEVEHLVFLHCSV